MRKWQKADAEVEHVKYWLGMNVEGRQVVFTRPKLFKELGVSMCACVNRGGVGIWTLSLLPTVFGAWLFFGLAINLSWLFKYVHY
jgi:hypothetical protein